MTNIIEEKMLGACKDYGNAMAHLRAAEPVLAHAQKFQGLWQGRSKIVVAFGGFSIDCVCLDLTLAEGDSLKHSANHILEACLDDASLQFIGQNEYPDMQWIMWKFYATYAPIQKYANYRTNIKLGIRIWYGESASCKQVGTGEFIEKTKLVCEETAA